MKKQIVLTSVISSIMFCGPAFAAKWEVTRSVSVREVLSDNINLEEDNEDSDLVTDITPRITVVGKGKRLNVQLDYRMQSLVHANESDDNTINHRLAASAKSELIEDRLFFDTSAGIRQVLSNTLLGASSDSISGSGNLDDVYNFSASPMWTQKVGDAAEFDLRYTYDVVASDSNSGDSTGNSVVFNLTNGPDITRLFWDGNYRYSMSDSNGGDESMTELATLTVGYRLFNSFSLNLSGFQEDNEFEGDRGDVDPDDSYYGVGFTWSPSQNFSFTAAYNERNDPQPDEDKNFGTASVIWSPTVRTQIIADYGNRFFGETFSLQFSHNTRRTTSALSYSETVSDFRRQILTPTIIGNLICPISALNPDGSVFASDCRVGAVGETPGPGELPAIGLVDILPSISDDTFILEQLTASFSINGVRNGITFSVNTQQREFVADGDTEEDLSISVAWSYKIGPRTRSQVTVRRTDREFDGGEEDELFDISWLVSAELSEKTSLSFSLGITDRDSSGNGRSYEENRATISLNNRF